MDHPATARLGILMLDTRFPRIPGDVGNPATFDFPVSYKVVTGATPDAIVCADPEPFVKAFIAVGQQLISQGCTGIATTCGFLSLLRPRLAQALGVPVAASALEQVAQIQAALPVDRVVGIVTISAASLTRDHLSVAGVPSDCPVVGTDGGSFSRAILASAPTLDVAAARAEVVQAARSLVAARPDVGAIVLECTNMPPYAAEVARATGRPVHTIVSYLKWFHDGLAPPVFPA